MLLSVFVTGSLDYFVFKLSPATLKRGLLVAIFAIVCQLVFSGFDCWKQDLVSLVKPLNPFGKTAYWYFRGFV